MSTLVIPDLHEPFSHERALWHCKEVYKTWGCDRVVCIGDFVDHHRISRHTSEPDGMDAVQEYDAALKRLQGWYTTFPSVVVVVGNHDEIPKRQAKEIGLPETFLRSLEDVYEFPDNWSIRKRIVIDDVLYLHNAGSGKYAAINKAREQSMSVVAGHTHRNPGIIYQSNPNKMFFGMNVGCLVDKDAYAMRYSDSEITLGCGVVVDSEEAYFCPMKMS